MKLSEHRELTAIPPGAPENRIGFGVGVLHEDRQITIASEGIEKLSIWLNAPMIEQILIFLFFGAMTGVLAGMLGIGGGVITVPLLYFVLQYSPFPKDEVMHVAIATALATTFVTSCGAVWSHHQRKAVLYHTLKWIAPGLAAGCIAGAILTFYLPNTLLRYIFGVVVVLLSVYFFFPKLPPLHIASKLNWTLAIWTLVVGCLSTLLGVGGGMFMVPILLGYQMHMKNAVAVSSVTTLVSALFGSIAFIVIAQQAPPLPQTLGYIDLTGFLTLGLSSLLTTAVGVKLAHTLPTPLIKRIFACALAITGVALLIGK